MQNEIQEFSLALLITCLFMVWLFECLDHGLREKWNIGDGIAIFCIPFIVISIGILIYSSFRKL